MSDSLKVSLDDKHFDMLNILEQNELFKKLLYSNQQIDKEFIESMANNIEDIETKDIFLQILKPTGSRSINTIAWKKWYRTLSYRFSLLF